LDSFSSSPTAPAPSTSVAILAQGTEHRPAVSGVLVVPLFNMSCPNAPGLNHPVRPPGMPPMMPMNLCTPVSSSADAPETTPEAPEITPVVPDARRVRPRYGVYTRVPGLAPCGFVCCARWGPAPRPSDPASYGPGTPSTLASGPRPALPHHPGPRSVSLHPGLADGGLGSASKHRRSVSMHPDLPEDSAPLHSAPMHYDARSVVVAVGSVTLRGRVLTARQYR